jgi:hypothetical protein
MITSRMMGVTAVLSGLAGCISVQTPDTHVQVGPPFFEAGSGEYENQTAYAAPLNRVYHQQARVSRELAEGDWNDTIKAAVHWVDYTRELSSYAGAAHDPALFQQCCQDLLPKVEAVRQAAMRQNLAECQEAVAACSPPLDKLMQTFPQTVPEAMAAARGARRTAPAGAGAKFVP